MKDHPGYSDDALPMRRSQVPPVTPPPVDYVEDYRVAEPPPTMGAKKISLGLVLRALRRHWWQALLLWTIGTTAMVSLVYTQIKPTFDAASNVRVELDNSAIFGSGPQQVDPAQFMKTQTRLILSPNVIGAALSEKPELANTTLLRGSSDPEYDIRQALMVGVIPGTNLIQIEMSLPKQSEATALVNAVTNAYLKQATETYDQSTQRRIDLLKPTLVEQETAVIKQRALVQSLVDQIGIDAAEQVQDHNRAPLEAFKRWNEQLTEVQIKVITAQAKLNQLRSLKDLPRQQNADQITLAVNEEFFNEPQVVALQNEMSRAESKLKDAERLARNEGDPSVGNAKRKVKDLKARYEALWKQLEPRLRKRVVSAPFDTSSENAIKEAELECQSLVVMQETLSDKMNKVRVEDQAGRSKQKELEFANHDLQPPNRCSTGSSRTWINSGSMPAIRPPGSRWFSRRSPPIVRTTTSAGSSWRRRRSSSGSW